MSTGKITIEGAKIGFRNFAGVESQYNKAGQRNFCVFLQEQAAAELKDAGWNVKFPSPRENDERDLQPYLPVEVSYRNYPPKIMVIANDQMHPLPESEVEMLDWAEIEFVDLIIRPYNWEIQTKHGLDKGVKAYLQTMYVTIYVDELEKKYTKSG